MKKIEKLTPAQEFALVEYRDKWLKIGLDTTPANRPEAEAAVRLAYECGGLLPPKIIVWLRSPIEGAIGAAMLADKKLFRAQVWDQVLAQVWAQVRDQVGAQVRDQVRAQVWAQVRDQVGAQVRDQVWAQVWAQVRDQVGAQVRDQVYRAGYGQHDANWLGFYEFFLEQCGLEAPKRLQGLLQLSQSCGWFWPFEGVVILTERPTDLHRDTANRLHNEIGPALRYPDGFSLWKWHGVTVPQYVIDKPEQITIQKIDAETNSEVKRIMMERYGFERYLREADAKLIDSCPEDHALKGMRTAKLWIAGGFPFLDLLNSTPEPDGTTKRYVIAVDGDRYNGRAGRECVAASASTWRKRGDPTQLAFERPEDYAPAFES